MRALRYLGRHVPTAMWSSGPTDRVLDVGCYDGGILAIYRGRVAELHGIDVDAEAIAAAQQKLPEATLAVSAAEHLPYPDGHFDVAFFLEVLEHVEQEGPVLAELARVLKPGGALILSTPFRGPLTILDPLNFKLRFPGLHRLAHRLLHRRSHYMIQYYERSDQVADEERMYADMRQHPELFLHRHYKVAELQQLLGACGLEIEEICRRGGLLTAIVFILAPLAGKLLGRKWYSPRFSKWLTRLDYSIDYGPLALDIVVRARKR